MMHNTLPRFLVLVAVGAGSLAWWLPMGRLALAVNGSNGSGTHGSGTRAKLTQPISSYLERSEIKQSENSKQRLREGTRITNRLGRFQQEGDRATFVTENNIELGGLPNLNLERVVRMLKGVDEPESIWWSVSGLVTEFSGRNYLLIERAVYKSANTPPIPDKVEP